VAAQLHQLGLVQFTDASVRIEKGEPLDVGAVKSQTVRVVVGVATKGHVGPIARERRGIATAPRFGFSAWVGPRDANLMGFTIYD
jgi:hypothetical protein